MKVVLTDIEGTTTPIDFVHRVLFPYARERLASHVRARPEEPAVAALVAAEGGADAAIARLQAWSDADVKATPLKAVQGSIWAAGYADGSLRAPLYPDVLPRLRAWRAEGLRLAVFSSGSVLAQRLLFGHTDQGDLLPLFDGFFDTTTGPKREAGSYLAIARALGVGPAEVWFLSDVEAELDAAAEAGLRTTLVARDGQAPGALVVPPRTAASVDGSRERAPSGRHPVVSTFADL